MYVRRHRVRMKGTTFGYIKGQDFAAREVVLGVNAAAGARVKLEATNVVVAEKKAN